MKRPVRIALLSVGALVVLLLGADLAASFTQAGNAAIFVEDKDLFLVRKPDQYGYTLGNGIWSPCHINKQGLRGDDLPDARPAGERWILCIGDSFTFGGGVEEAEAWPQQLQALLGAPESSGLRVLNGGANGWDTRWQRRYLQARALDQFHPDIVVLGWNWNDLNMDVNEDTGPQYVRRVLQAEGSWLSVFARWEVLRESHLYRWLYTTSHGALHLPSDEALQRSFKEYGELIAKVGVEPETKIADARHKRFGAAPPDMSFWESTDTAVWKLVRTEMTAAKAACDAKGATLVVAIFPEPTWMGPETFPGTDRLAAMLDALGVPWIDVQPDFMQRGPRGGIGPRRGELWQRYDPVHPVPAGQAIMAQDVLRLLREHALVPAEAPAGAQH